ncbi:MAG: hypothetical protein OSJ67_02470 [Clostridia bacterium]|nr:hypothetical protein [Clostridia bacterium]
MKKRVSLVLSIVFIMVFVTASSKSIRSPLTIRKDCSRIRLSVTA